MKNTVDFWTCQATHSFDALLCEARKRIGQLSKEKQEELKEMLNHGQSYLSNSDLLDMYLCCYGEIHRQKLLIAFGRLPQSIFLENGFSVVDYACGQGLAELVLVDFLVKNRIDRERITDLHLIDTSKACLYRARKYISQQIPFAKLYFFNSKLENVNYEDLRIKSHVVIHLFSNILDIPNVIIIGWFVF